MPCAPENCPAFVIGLERTADRYRAVQAAWRAIGVDVRLWSGVDGIRALEYRANESLRWKERPSVSLPAVIACYLSHFRLWRHCLEQGYERVLILEDDALPRPAVETLLPELLELPSSYELIRFFAHYQPVYIKNPRTMRRYTVKTLDAKPYILHRPYTDLWGTESFLVHRRGLEKLAARAMPIESPVDQYLYRIHFHKTRLYHVFPDVVRLLEQPSTIQKVDASKNQQKDHAQFTRATYNEFELWDVRYLWLNYVCLVRNLIYMLREAEHGDFVRRGRIPPYLLRQVALRPVKLVWNSMAMLGRIILHTISSGRY